MLFLNHQIGASFGTPLRKRGEIADRSVGDIGQSFLGKKRCVCSNRERECVCVRECVRRYGMTGSSVGDIGQCFLGKKRCVCSKRERVCVCVLESALGGMV